MRIRDGYLWPVGLAPVALWSVPNGPLYLYISRLFHWALLPGLGEPAFYYVEYFAYL